MVFDERVLLTRQSRKAASKWADGLLCVIGWALLLCCLLEEGGGRMRRRRNVVWAKKYCIDGRFLQKNLIFFGKKLCERSELSRMRASGVLTEAEKRRVRGES